jgi:Fe-S cluster assembly protein SufD
VSTAFAPVDPASLRGSPELLRVRRAALARFEAGPLPTDAEEIWRYSRVGDLDPGAWTPASAPRADQPTPGEVARVLERVGDHAAFALTVDGYLSVHDAGSGVDLARADIDTLTSVAEPWDAFAELNAAQAPDPLVIDVPGGTVVEEPIVVCHWVASDGRVTFPRVVVRVAGGAEVTVIEYHASDDVRAWVDPVTELHVADGAHLTHVTVQELGSAVWQTGFLAASVGRDAVLRASTVALGGAYARSRTDSRIVGTGGSAELAALYCGSGTQMHDFRTLQDHAAPKSSSDLLFKGAVSDEASSAYSGLIRVRRGAAGTRAFQTNRNLVLSESGLATYSVPNLDIEENDVSCSHASATGPIDPDQRFYLESRGVPPEIADRLIVLGFFADVIDRLPTPGLRAHVADVISAKLRVGG